MKVRASLPDEFARSRYLPALVYKVIRNLLKSQVRADSAVKDLRRAGEAEAEGKVAIRIIAIKTT